ncbi:hypothetical protein EDD11_000090 [Mortierella claussenii]|nr:hypothetical protein EDD11_000090 [Mortierella claussenii]
MALRLSALKGSSGGVPGMAASSLRCTSAYKSLASSSLTLRLSLSTQFFSSSARTTSRHKPTLTTTRTKKRTASPSASSSQQQQQQVRPQEATSSATTGPTVGKITPLYNVKARQPQKVGYNERLQHDRGPHSQQHPHQQRQQQQYAGFNPWLLRIFESRRVAIRAFTFGSILTLTGFGLYSYSTSSGRSKRKEQWAQLQQELTLARSSFTYSHPNNPAPSPFTEAATRPRFEKQLKMLTSEQVEERLAVNEKSFRVKTKEEDRKNREREEQDLILGYCINQVASNNPIEDDLSRHVMRGQDGSLEKVFFGVFDGHGGWCCSQKVAQELAPMVAAELERLPGRGKKTKGKKSESSSSLPSSSSAEGDVMAVMEAIENGFLKLDDQIVNETVRKVLEMPSRPLACSSLLPAISGSCALLTYVDVKEKDLYVACTGDSRAVLGVCEKNGGGKGKNTWKAVPLSFDQTGRNRWEVRRMQEEHPGEEDTVVMRGRVLGGLEPTRAFGDARYKWTLEIQERVFQLFPSYRQPHRNYHTPPYVTAKPVVKHHKIRPEDRFLVMATDGLWDKLTSAEVVQLVGDLLDGKTGKENMVLDRDQENVQQKLEAVKKAMAAGAAAGAAVAAAAAGAASAVGSAVGVKVTGKKGEQTEEGQELTPANLLPKGPVSQVRQFTFKDPTNASTHLVRNALGGGDDDKLAATLSIPAPMSRIYRDDITVTVIFFGSQDTHALGDAQDNDGFVEID